MSGGAVARWRRRGQGGGAVVGRRRRRCGGGAVLGGRRAELRAGVRRWVSSCVVGTNATRPPEQHDAAGSCTGSHH
jgi:hypothetical protein